MKASSPAMTDLAPCCGGDQGVSQSQPCGEASADAEVFAGLSVGATAAERAAHRANPRSAYTSQVEREGMCEPLPSELTREEFCVRFKARMLAVAGPQFAQDGPDAPESVADYADQVGPSYFDDPDQREEGPEACAEADISYWEES